MESSDIQAWKESATSLIQQGGLPLMALAVALSDSIPLIPTQPISIAAGAVFGFSGGLSAVVVGQALATAFAFGIGRYVIKKTKDNANDNNTGDDDDDDWILNNDEISNNNTPEENSKLEKVLKELISPLNSGNWWTVFTTIVVARQSPVLPFSVGNYFVGAGTNAPLLPAWLGTIVGCLPLNSIWVLTGSSGMAALDAAVSSSSSSSDSPTNGVANLQQGLELFGIVVTVGFIAYTIKTIWSVYAGDSSSSETVIFTEQNMSAYGTMTTDDSTEKASTTTADSTTTDEEEFTVDEERQKSANNATTTTTTTTRTLKF
eukprot:CAMPEP_0178902992 /NCGR_PEP_ID=MMETSP0786-20121207/4913_1 /TAXON_ID=186022 /ORGANISM="Thalassionema frauenfeldii, Strain CCMP 1798" /LENGTH=317 /DNA_ID=CAMNT_0020574321 /DNA_START=159 /DNA_END=1112 /DNA_ORIENTATION=+